MKYKHGYNKHKLDNDFFLENMCPLMTYSAMWKKRGLHKIFKTPHCREINYATDLLKTNKKKLLSTFIRHLGESWCKKMYGLPSNENSDTSILWGRYPPFGCSCKSIKPPLPMLGREASCFNVTIREEADCDAAIIVSQLNGTTVFLWVVFTLADGWFRLCFIVS